MKFHFDKLQCRIPKSKYVDKFIYESKIKTDLSQPTANNKLNQLWNTKSKSKIKITTMLGCYTLLKFVFFASLRKILHENLEFSWGESWLETFKNDVELGSGIPILVGGIDLMSN